MKLIILVCCLFLLFSCEKSQENINNIQYEIFAMENDVEIIINNYQISNNLIAIQLKITNNTEDIVFIPRPESQKWELVNNELIITRYYNWEHSNWKGAHRVIPETYVIEPNKTVYFSIHCENTIMVVNYSTNEKFDLKRERRFYRLIGKVNKIKIILGIFIDNMDNYISERYSEHTVLEEYKFNENIKMIQIECLIDEDNIIDYNIINN